VNDTLQLVSVKCNAVHVRYELCRHCVSDVHFCQQLYLSFFAAEEWTRSRNKTWRCCQDVCILFVLRFLFHQSLSH